VKLLQDRGEPGTYHDAVRCRQKGGTVSLSEQPAPTVDGEVRFDQGTRAAAAEDFGHLVRRPPAGVLLPGSGRDVAAGVRWAAERGRRFAAQGNRHSVFGRGQAADGIVADLRRLRAVHDVQDDRVVVDAGATWREVLAATLPRGLAPPALPDYLDLSVGGTLVVGGIGSRTWRAGAVSDNVLELEVVTGRGEQLSCSPASNPRLFDAVRAGLGQVAVITGATLRLVPAPRTVRRFLLFYPDLAAMLGDQRLLAREPRFEVVQGAVLAAPAGGWTFRLDVVKELSGRPPDDGELLAGLADDRSRAEPSTLPYLDYLDRLAALERALRANGQWRCPHPWLTTFVGDAAVERVVAAALAGLEPADLGPLGQVALSPILRASVGSPLLRLPADRLGYAFNLIRLPSTDDPVGADRLVAANRAAYERVRDAGGTLYPVSAFPMSGADWRGHFGEAFGLLGEIKDEHDPGRVLTPGYEVF
jgi:FAD/FMN-containing dehydrogenase